MKEGREDLDKLFYVFSMYKAEAESEMCKCLAGFEDVRPHTEEPGARGVE